MCENKITEKDLIPALKSMPNSKSPGHDGLNKKIYDHVSDNLNHLKKN